MTFKDFKAQLISNIEKHLLFIDQNIKAIGITLLDSSSEAKRLNHLLHQDLTRFLSLANSLKETEIKEFRSQVNSHLQTLNSSTLTQQEKDIRNIATEAVLLTLDVYIRDRDVERTLFAMLQQRFKEDYLPALHNIRESLYQSITSYTVTVKQSQDQIELIKLSDEYEDFKRILERHENAVKNMNAVTKVYAKRNVQVNEECDFDIGGANTHRCDGCKRGHQHFEERNILIKEIPNQNAREKASKELKELKQIVTNKYGLFTNVQLMFDKLNNEIENLTTKVKSCEPKINDHKALLKTTEQLITRGLIATTSDELSGMNEAVADLIVNKTIKTECAANSLATNKVNAACGNGTAEAASAATINGSAQQRLFSTTAPQQNKLTRSYSCRF